MLEARIGRRMRATDMADADADAYYNTVINDLEERNQFIDQVTTHETSFFRTSRIWQYLEDVFLPAWHDQNPHQTCHIWSAAAASGEEAYSLAISMKTFAQTNPGFTFAIDATDISSEIIKKSKLATFRQRSITSFQRNRPEQFAKYMTANEDRYQLDKKLVQLVNFGTHNLFTKPTKKNNYHLVLLRNVLIYFTLEDQRTVLKQVRRSMRDNALLVIGESESITNLDTQYRNLQPFIYQTTPNSAAATVTNE